MTRIPRLLTLALFATLAVATAASARGLGVDVWTDRGDDAVYQPGEALQVKARTNEDAYLLVYSISTEGDVRLLWPVSHGRGFAEGRRTYRIPSEAADYDLVADNQTGQGYVVAIASSRPFRAMPWYLRPYDVQAEDNGYENYRDEDEQEGVTREGRIVGDPFVAMERIRRRVVEDAEDQSSFATSYASYYVHELVRYPRYVCYDCHRPGRWSWWDGFDPYYTRCSVFDFRVNWGWSWGPTCWTGYVPYYFYVIRDDCPPYYRRWHGPGRHWSSWDGWHNWNQMWGSHLVRYKTPPPQGYVPPPPRGGVWRGDSPPPGLISRQTPRGGSGAREQVPIGRRNGTYPGSPGGTSDTRPRDGVWRGGDGSERPSNPGGEVRPRQGSPGDSNRRGDPGDRRPAPRQPEQGSEPRRGDQGDRQPAPRQEQPRQESPRFEPPHRNDDGNRQPAPRQEQPRQEQPRQEQPRQEQPRQDSPRHDGGSKFDPGSSRGKPGRF